MVLVVAVEGRVWIWYLVHYGLVGIGLVFGFIGSLVLVIGKCVFLVDIGWVCFWVLWVFLGTLGI